MHLSKTALVALAATLLSPGGVLVAQTTASTTQTVGKRNTIGAVTVTPPTGILAGSAVTLGYTLHTAGAPAPTASSVQFMDGATALGSPQQITSSPAVNLLPYSQIDTAQGWTTTGTAPVVTPNQGTGPDGSATSSTQVAFPVTTGTSSGVMLAVPGTAYASQSLTVSVWAQAAAPATLTLGLTDSPATTASGSNTCAVTTAWQRCTFTYTMPANAGTGFAVTLSSANQSAATVQLWGAQVEQASQAGPYVSTIGVARPTGAAAGAVSFNFSQFHAGPHSVSATFPGDTNFTGSSSSPLTFTVGKSTPTITVTPSAASPVAYGTPVTFTVALTGTGFTPTGTVQFFDNGTLIGTGTVNSSGVATLTLSGATSLSAGTHTITATYGGDSDNNTVTSVALTYVVSKGNGTLTTSVVSLRNPSTYGDAVCFSITVSTTAGATPTGTVTVADGATTLGTATLDASGHATFTTSALTAGSHTVNVTYSGDSNYN